MPPAVGSDLHCVDGLTAAAAFWRSAPPRHRARVSLRRGAALDRGAVQRLGFDGIVVRAVSSRRRPGLLLWARSVCGAVVAIFLHPVLSAHLFEIGSRLSRTAQHIVNSSRSARAPAIEHAAQPFRRNQQHRSHQLLGLGPYPLFVEKGAGRLPVRRRRQRLYRLPPGLGPMSWPSAAEGNGRRRRTDPNARHGFRAAHVARGAIGRQNHRGVPSVDRYAMQHGTEAVI